eukprot:333778-Hanusia_phi.AAC.4
MGTVVLRVKSGGCQFANPSDSGGGVGVQHEASIAGWSDYAPDTPTYPTDLPPGGGTVADTG